MKPYLLTLLSICFIGCASIYTQPQNPTQDYQWHIKFWQERIKRDGWSDPLVKNIMDGCIKIAKYKPDAKNIDHWKSYREFMMTGYIGDCEDIATFMFGTLKRLNYPHDVKMRIVSLLSANHALISVEMPSGKRKQFNSTPMIGDSIDLALAKTVVEWNEDHIEWQ